VNSILNISAYKFVALNEIARWRESIHSQAQARLLKGTILLAREGLNLFLAGTQTDTRAFLSWLTSHEEFADLPIKESWSEQIPFGKLLVRVKPEIIRMNHPTIEPQARRAGSIDAKTLARWLDQGADDEGREVVMLDTRNAFEVEHGRFRGAIDWRIGKFSDFPRALAEHLTELEGKTVVSYCTGGIRCEKAALLMAQTGVANVLQLDGGILRYFEETGGKHFEGDCFVFDERGLLNGALSPARSV
jgi:UPF0176 protein